jgi:hypothetical protein
MKSISSSNYQEHRLYPTIARAVAGILATNNVVTPIEVLLRMQRLTKQHHEDWRFGRIPYLERVCVGSLSKLNTILRILDHHAQALGLKPSQTVYHKWGRGGKRIILRFSKSGAPPLEAAYSRHYVACSKPAAATREDNCPPMAPIDAEQPGRESYSSTGDAAPQQNKPARRKDGPRRTATH